MTTRTAGGCTARLCTHDSMYRWASIAKYPGVQNFFGFPGLSVPIGFDSVSGLPMAMQITTLTGEEALGFRIGHAYERVTPEIQMNQPVL